MEYGLKGFGEMFFILLINTVVLAIGLFVPREFYTDSSMRQGNGNLLIFVYPTQPGLTDLAF